MRPRRTVRLTTALVGIIVVLGACRQEPALGIRYEDFLTSGRVASSAQTVTIGEHWHDDETHLAIALGPGEVLSATASLGGDARLEVGAALDLSEMAEASGGAAAQAGELVVITEVLGGGQRIERSLPVVAGAGWTSLAVELSSLRGATVRIRLQARLPDDRPGHLHVHRFVLEHQVPVTRPTRDRPPSILLISVDTLREDAIGAIGGGGLTPALDRFIAQSQLWSPHYATSSWTKPSHASLLSGQHPWLHNANWADDTIDPGVLMLAERFHAAGWLTAGLVYDCIWLAPEVGFGRGFDEYRVVPWRLEQMVRYVTNWLQEHRDESFFFFLHTFDVHSDYHRLPYEAPGVTQQSIAERFGAPQYRGYGCRAGVCATELLRQINKEQRQPLPGEGEILRYLYDEGVRDADRQLGLLLGNLQSLGLLDELVIVLTSDHGESFLEHGKVLHQPCYWDEVLRVPLVIRWPDGRGAGQRSHTLSSSVDVAPTLLAACGLPIEDLPGRDLLRPQGERAVFAMTARDVVVGGGFKGVFQRAMPERSLLYDLSTDPGELHDLGYDRPEIVERLLGELERRVQEDQSLRRRMRRPSGEVALSEEQEQRLRALGYLDE